MILVTLGTQDKKFTRLLNDIEKQIENGTIKEEVIVQAGCTKFESKYMKIFDLIAYDEFNELIKKCNLLITHGGVGSIITGLKNKKIIIAAARLKKYREHTNDHQLQIIDNFSEEGYILAYNETDNLKDILEKSKTFKPKKFVSSKDKLVKLVKDYIDSN